MNDNEAFIRAILADPGDQATRLVYADWLEENGDQQRAEFLRLDAVLAEKEAKQDDRAEQRERVRTARMRGRLMRLQTTLDPMWLAAVGHHPIENCVFQFAFKCPQRWDRLKATEDVAVRSCDQCRRKVYYCCSVDEVRRHALAGDCVALDRRIASAAVGLYPDPRSIRSAVVGRIALPQAAETPVILTSEPDPPEVDRPRHDTDHLSVWEERRYFKQRDRERRERRK